VDTLQFGDPQLLWLLLVPALLALLWVRLVLARRRDAGRLTAARQTPVGERFPLLGDAPFWLCGILTVALLVLALAQPAVIASFVRRAGIDIVVLLDGSASMHVRDVAGNRWQRSIQFLRTLGDQMSWDDDRLSLTLFAHIAAPQVRLTRDPNTFFFFLDHLDEAPPFRLEDDTSWDTNIALGIEWGLRVIDRDADLRGPSPNAKVFLLLTDGQAWSGAVEDALRLVRARDIPVYVVGVGTLQGGIIPDPKRLPGSTQPAIRSRLDRTSLLDIATTTAGRYLELEREPDTVIAARIVDAARRRAVSAEPEPTLQPLYWQFLLGAAGAALAALLFLRDRAALALQVAGGAVTLAIVTAILG
jgi:Ca-activated chloride channel family protein